ncbi:MAG TPA: flagellar filament capping protein FliD [Terriglobales bacterium]|nr:flagellar filament capping protein FliD [Terriglobales bacterium]
MSTNPLNLSSLLSAFGSSQPINVPEAVSQALAAIAAPEVQWQNEQQTLQTETTALNSMENDVTALESTMTAMGDPAGALASMTTSSSDSSLVTATAANGAASANHVVVVNNLATTSSWYSNSVASGTTALQAGTFTIQVGTGTATQITVGTGTNTLDDLANTINGMNLGVTANVVTDASGARLSIVSNNSGAASNITISADTTIGFTRAATGVDASLTVDGIPINSASNSVTGAVNGVTLNLVGASPGTQVDVVISPDVNSASTAISNFVSAFNKVIGDVNTQFTVTNNTEGPVASDPNVRLVQSDLLSAGGYSTESNAVATLADLGISMNKDGTLTLDSATLNSAIQNNFGAVQSFLQGTSSNGFVNFLNNQLTSLTDPASGAFTVDLQSINSENSDLQNQINNFQPYLQQQQTLLTNEFNQADIALEQLPTEEAQINAELGYPPSSGTTIL